MWTCLEVVLGMIQVSLFQDTSSSIQGQNNKHESAAVVQSSRNCHNSAKLAGVHRRDKDLLGLLENFSAVPLFKKKKEKQKNKKQRSAKTKMWDQWNIAKLAMQACLPCPLSPVYTLSKQHMSSHVLRKPPPESVVSKHYMNLYHMIPPETSISV